MKPIVVIGLLGVNLDNVAKKANRWQRWRPSVALCQHEDLLIQRFELLLQPKYQRLAHQLIDDIGTVSPC